MFGLSGIPTDFPFRFNLIYIVYYVLDFFWEVLCVLFNVIEKKVETSPKRSRPFSLNDQLLSKFFNSPIFGLQGAKGKKEVDEE